MSGTNFCHFCRAETTPQTQVCANCGATFASAIPSPGAPSVAPTLPQGQPPPPAAGLPDRASQRLAPTAAAAPAAPSASKAGGLLFCLKCGTPAPTYQKYCTKCGGPLVDSPFTTRPAPAWERKVPDHLGFAMLVTVLCFMPAGIIALIYSLQVRRKLAAGNYAGAQAASTKAQICCWIGVAAAILSWVAYAAIFAFLTAGLRSLLP